MRVLKETYQGVEFQAQRMEENADCQIVSADIVPDKPRWKLKLRLMLILRNGKGLPLHNLIEEYEDLFEEQLFPEGMDSSLALNSLCKNIRDIANLKEAADGSVEIFGKSFSRKDFIEVVHVFKSLERRERTVVPEVTLDDLDIWLADQDSANNSSGGGIPPSSDFVSALAATLHPQSLSSSEENLPGPSGLFTVPHSVPNFNVAAVDRSLTTGQATFGSYMSEYNRVAEDFVNNQSLQASTEISVLAATEGVRSSLLTRATGRNEPCSKRTVEQDSLVASVPDTQENAPISNLPASLTHVPVSTPPWSSPKDSEPGYPSTAMTGSGSEQSHNDPVAENSGANHQPLLPSTDIPVVASSLNRKRPNEGGEPSSKRIAVEPQEVVASVANNSKEYDTRLDPPAMLTPAVPAILPWTSPASSDPGYSSAAMTGSASERSCNNDVESEYVVTHDRLDNGIAETNQVVTTTEDASRGSLAGKVNDKDRDKRASHNLRSSRCNSKRARRSAKDDLNHQKNKSTTLNSSQQSHEVKRASNSGSISRGDSAGHVNVKGIFEEIFQSDTKSVMSQGERKLKSGLSNKYSIVNVEDWGFSLSRGSTYRALFIGGTNGTFKCNGKDFVHVDGFSLPAKSAIYAEHDEENKVFRIYDAAAIADVKLDEDFDERRQQIYEQVEALSNQNEAYIVEVASVKRIIEYSRDGSTVGLVGTLDRLESKKEVRIKGTRPKRKFHVEEIVFFPCYRRTTKFLSVLKGKLSWNLPSCSKLKMIRRTLEKDYSVEEHGGLDFTLMLLGEW